jgi:hypothetical protein
MDLTYTYVRGKPTHRIDPNGTISGFVLLLIAPWSIDALAPLLADLDCKDFDPTIVSFIAAPSGASLDANMSEAAFHPHNYLWCYGKVHSGGDWDYKVSAHDKAYAELVCKP